MTHATEAAALYRERSPVNHANKITVPLLVLQGDRDNTVPKAQADALVEARNHRRRTGTGRKVPHPLDPEAMTIEFHPSRRSHMGRSATGRAGGPYRAPGATGRAGEQP